MILYDNGFNSVMQTSCVGRADGQVNCLGELFLSPNTVEVARRMRACRIWCCPVDGRCPNVATLRDCDRNHEPELSKECIGSLNSMAEAHQRGKAKPYFRG